MRVAAGLCRHREMGHTVAMSGNGTRDDRRERLAKQLRANLARRKAQARAVRDGEADSRPAGLDAAADDGNEDPGDGEDGDD